MEKFRDGFSVTYTTEIGNCFERINNISLNYKGYAVATIVNYHIGEPNKPTNKMCVIFHYTDLYYSDCNNWSTEVIDFFQTYIGCVTESDSSNTYCDNLLWHMYNHFWLVTDRALKEFDSSFDVYYPKIYYAYQYVKATQKTTSKIRVIIK